MTGPSSGHWLPLLAGLRWFWYTSTLKPNSDTSCLGLRLPPQKDTQSTTTPNARFSVNLPVPDRSCLGGRASACSDSVFHFDMPSGGRSNWAANPCIRRLSLCFRTSGLAIRRRQTALAAFVSQCPVCRSQDPGVEIPNPNRD